MGACLPAFRMVIHANLSPLPARFTLTDFEALDVDQVAGNTLTANLVALRGLQYSGQTPITGIDGFELPTNMVAQADVII